MKNTGHLIAAFLACTVIADPGVGFAQPPVPAAPAPTRPYPPPPPRYDGQPPPFDYPFGAVPPSVVAAPASAETADGEPARDLSGFSFTMGIGSGGFFGPGEKTLALSYQPFRLTYGLDPKLAVFLAFEGVGTSSVNPRTQQDSWLSQDTWSLGLQGRLAQRLYLRGGLGLGSVSETVGEETFEGGRGLGVSGALGFDLWNRSHVGLSLELGGSYTHYARESWKTLGLAVAVSIF
jgi:hypothetical protein